jgi:hypothetical protein
VNNTPRCPLRDPDNQTRKPADPQRPDTDAALLADAVAASIDREGLVQVCCAGLGEAPRALLAMAEARDWLRLYRMKDFAVAAEAGGMGDGGGGGGGAVWPLTLTLLECKWNSMTYFKY